MSTRRVRRAIAIAPLIVALGASGAVAANLSGDGTIVGTTGSDNLAAGNQNDTIWGLGGQDSISAGNGNDTIDGNGKCGPGVAAGVYPNGLPSTKYCQHGPIPGSGNGDNISAGNGNDVVYGGGGPNNISVGSGTDTVYAGPSTNNISVGSGGGTIYAQNGHTDNISCGSKNSYTVYADRNDNVKGCKSVKYTSPAGDRTVHSTGRTVRHHAGHSRRALSNRKETFLR